MYVAQNKFIYTINKTNIFLNIVDRIHITGDWQGDSEDSRIYASRS